MTEQEALIRLRKLIGGNLTLNITLAVQEMNAAILYLKGEKKNGKWDGKLFKYNTKYHALKAEKMADKRMSRIYSCASDEKFFGDYNDKAIDITESDIEKFRLALVRTMLDNGISHEYAKIFSHVEVAAVLLRLAVLHYDYIMKLTMELYPRDWSYDFRLYRLGELSNEWHHVCESLYPNYLVGVELNNAETDALYDALSLRITNGSLIGECLDAANQAMEDKEGKEEQA